MGLDSGRADGLSGSCGFLGMQHQHARTVGTGDVRPATKAALDFEQNLVKRGKKSPSMGSWPLPS